MRCQIVENHSTAVLLAKSFVLSLWCSTLSFKFPAGCAQRKGGCWNDVALILVSRGQPNVFDSNTNSPIDYGLTTWSAEIRQVDLNPFLCVPSHTYTHSFTFLATLELSMKTSGQQKQSLGILKLSSGQHLEWPRLCNFHSVCGGTALDLPSIAPYITYSSLFSPFQCLGPSIGKKTSR